MHTGGGSLLSRIWPMFRGSVGWDVCRECSRTMASRDSEGRKQQCWQRVAEVGRVLDMYRYQERRAQIGTRSSDRWAGLWGLMNRSEQRNVEFSPPRFDLGSVKSVRNVPKPCIFSERTHGCAALSAKASVLSSHGLHHRLYFIPLMQGHPG